MILMRMSATVTSRDCSTVLDLLYTPFSEFEFMQRALVGVIAIALGGGPIGVFLMLRRMSLTGDAMAHAILPGAAVGYLLAGLSLPAMTVGGLAAGVIVAVAAGLVSRFTSLKEDASLAAFYLLSLALGVTIVSLRGSNVDLLHVLFGTVLALDDNTLLLLASISTITVVALAVLYRPLVLECVDPIFLLVGIVSGMAGLLLSFHLELPAGPAIILSAGAIYVASLLLGRTGGVLWLAWPGKHLEA